MDDIREITLDADGAVADDADWGDQGTSPADNLTQVIVLLTLFESQPYLVKRGYLGSQTAEICDSVYNRISDIDRESGRPRITPAQCGRKPEISFYLGRNLVSTPGFYKWREVLRLGRVLLASFCGLDELAEPEPPCEDNLGVSNFEDGRMETHSSVFALLDGVTEEDDGSLSDLMGPIPTVYDTKGDDDLGIRGVGSYCLHVGDIVEPATHTSYVLPYRMGGVGEDGVLLQSDEGTTLFVRRKSRKRFFRKMLADACRDLITAGMVPEDRVQQDVLGPTGIGVLVEAASLASDGTTSDSYPIASHSQASYLIVDGVGITYRFASQIGMSLMKKSGCPPDRIRGSSQALYGLLSGSPATRTGINGLQLSLLQRRCTAG
jgi:hypothetical protein